MIAADRDELVAEVKQRAIQIRRKEITLFHNNLSILATQCTFLTTLCFSGLCMLPDQIWHVGVVAYRTREAHHFIFYTCSTCGMCLNMAAAIVASHGMIYGPSLAIRGPHGPMSRAAQAMYQTRRRVLRLFWSGLFFLMLSIISIGWLKVDRITASFMTVVTLLFLALTAFYILGKLRKKFIFSQFKKSLGHLTSQRLLVHGYDPERGMHVNVNSSSFGDAGYAVNADVRAVMTTKGASIQSL